MLLQTAQPEVGFLSLFPCLLCCVFGFFFSISICDGILGVSFQHREKVTVKHTLLSTSKLKTNPKQTKRVLTAVCNQRKSDTFRQKLAFVHNDFKFYSTRTVLDEGIRVRKTILHSLKGHSQRWPGLCRNIWSFNPALELSWPRDNQGGLMTDSRSHKAKASGWAAIRTQVTPCSVVQ